MEATIGKSGVLIADFEAVCRKVTFMGAYEASMVELFPTRSRYSGVAFCHNLAFALFAGSTPMLLEWFCSLGRVMAPAYLMAFCAILLLLSTCGWEGRYQDELSHIPVE
ncbi:hypothetical protein NX722_09130 [Endozoicomonas gorgoniicola]|uniref:Uncharacterized protein n=1 Tax=Endozoicomonas gorgoniicola TaxID=1234144 RepID=A0ABT3MTT4_9GAMM|nr:hypothetical protein [Endozoicomonas gorgoniicola]MCW7552802.1 hypothetical protein [Endozoicomonas gorgoniicola]